MFLLCLRYLETRELSSLEPEPPIVHSYGQRWTLERPASISGKRNIQRCQISIRDRILELGTGLSRRRFGRFHCGQGPQVWDQTFWGDIQGWSIATMTTDIAWRRRRADHAKSSWVAKLGMIRHSFSTHCTTVRARLLLKQI